MSVEEKTASPAIPHNPVYVFIETMKTMPDGFSDEEELLELRRLIKDANDSAKTNMTPSKKNLINARHSVFSKTGKRVLEESPIHLAIKTFRHDVLWELLECGADFGTLDSTGISPLERACDFENLGAVNQLLDRGVYAGKRRGKAYGPLDMTDNKKIHTVIRNALKYY